MNTSSNINTRKLIMGSVAIHNPGRCYFFLCFFSGEDREVMGSEHYSEDELKEATLRDPLTSNTILSLRFYSKMRQEKFPYIENFSVKRSDRHKLIISVKEKRRGRLYSLSGQLYLF